MCYTLLQVLQVPNSSSTFYYWPTTFTTITTTGLYLLLMHVLHVLQVLQVLQLVLATVMVSTGRITCCHQMWALQVNSFLFKYSITEATGVMRSSWEQRNGLLDCRRVLQSKRPFETWLKNRWFQQSVRYKKCRKWHFPHPCWWKQLFLYTQVPIRDWTAETTIIA